MWNKDIRVGIPPFTKIKKTLLQKLTKKCIDLFDDYISKEGVPDIIHSHSFFRGLIGYELSNKYNIPLFHTACIEFNNKYSRI